MGHLHRTRQECGKALLYGGRASPAYLRDHGVGGNDVLHLLGPGVHETEPSTPQRDEGAVFDFKLVTVGVDLLSHLQHYGHTHHHHGDQQTSVERQHL